MLTAAIALATAALSSCCGVRQQTAGFDSTLYAPEYAGGFEIMGAGGRQSVLLRVHNPWQGAEDVESELLILRNGESAPEGFGGQVLVGEPSRIVCISSTHIALLDAAGAVEKIVGVSCIDYVSNQYVAANRHRIGDVGYEGNINYELLLALEPDLVMLYGLNGASSMEGKLRELGVPFVYVGDYLEESPLGKAEWIVAVGEIVGRREVAESVYREIPRRYNELKARVAGAGVEAPAVMVNTPYGDSWFMSPVTSFVAQTIADAGGRYIYDKNTTTRSLPIDLEEAALLVSKADFWINTGAVGSLDALKRGLPKFADAECVRRGNVWNCDARTNAAGGNDFWESGIVHPDIILRDLVTIFHPELVPDPETVYYRRLQ